MQVPVQIVFEHVAQSDAVEARVKSEAEKLEQFYERITAARVVIGNERLFKARKIDVPADAELALPPEIPSHDQDDAQNNAGHHGAAVFLPPFLDGFELFFFGIVDFHVDLFRALQGVC